MLEKNERRACASSAIGDRKKEMLEDIAVLTGGKLISEDIGTKLESVTVEDLGRADKIWSDRSVHYIPKALMTGNLSLGQHSGLETETTARLI